MEGNLNHPHIGMDFATASEGSLASTENTTDQERKAVRRMLTLEGTSGRDAHGELVNVILGHVVAALLAKVTRVAEVRLAPAVPGGQLAAELTLPLEILWSMSVTPRAWR
jgi:hypothetical protein